MVYSSSEPNTLSRRYELTTCLLEVWTERSPLSDWQSQIVAQNLRFRLILQQNHKVIKGNQQQITNLIEAVTSYCDRWLAHDEIGSLNHTIDVTKLSKLQLSTLQLFDLYESLELCANEFVILPSLSLEVRRLNLNWLKVVVGAIAMIGVSIGAVRLISRDQPNYQLATTTVDSSSTNSSSKKESIAPSARLEKPSENSGQVADSAKSVSPSTINPPIAESNSNSNLASPIPTKPLNRAPNQVAKSRENDDKVAIAPEPSNSSIGSLTGNAIGNSSSDRKRATENTPSISDGLTSGSSQQQTGRFGKDAAQPTTVAEASKPSPSAPSAKISVPSAAARSDTYSGAAPVNIKILQIQSELSTEITLSLVSYMQTQRIHTSETGTLSLDLEMSGDRIMRISIDNQSSILTDSSEISELKNVLYKWRSPSSVTGKIRLVLQL